MSDDPSEPVDDWPVQAATLRQEPATPNRSATTSRFNQVGVVLGTLALAVVVVRLFSGAGADDGAGPAPRVDDLAAASGDAADGTTPDQASNTSAVDLATDPTLQLVDGESIRLTSSGFRPDEVVAAMQCTEDPSRSEAATAEVCDTGTHVLLKADGDGVVDADFVVRRKLSLSGQVVDCSFGGCVIVATSTLGPSRTGSTPLVLWSGIGGFDNPPRVFVQPGSGLVDSASLEIEAINLEPGADYLVQQCVIGRADGVELCTPRDSPPMVTADDTGAATFMDRAGRFRYDNGNWLDCADPGTVRCVVQLRPAGSIESGVRQPGAFVLRYDNTIEAPIRLYSLSQTSGLVGSDPVVFNAEGPILQQGDPGVALCRVGVVDACTALTRDDTATTVSTITTVLRPPRRFTTWQGEIHDCVDTAPCELRFWMQDTVIYEYDLLVDFDPRGSAQVAETASLNRDGPFEEGDEVIASLNTTGRVRVVQCITGRRASCDERVARDLDANALNGVEIVMHRMITTPRGGHDCASEEPCELRFIIDNGYIEPLPVTFKPGEFVDSAIVVRPRDNHGHGTTAEIRTNVASLTRLVTSLCADSGSCVRLADLRLSAAASVARIRLPRYFSDPTMQTVENILKANAPVTDCGIEQCTLRISDGNQMVETELVFNGRDIIDESPAIVIGDNRGLVERQTVPIRVSGFFLVDPAESNPLTYRWCRTASADPSACALAEVTVRSLDETGSAETTLRLPEIEQTRATPGEDPVCLNSCWLVATLSPAFRSAATQLVIAAAR